MKVPTGGPAGKLVQQALTLQQQGQLPEAAKLFRRVLQTAPTDWRALFSLGRLTLQWGQVDEALKLVDRLVLVQPRYAEGHHLRGVILERLGRYEEALAAMAAGLALKPDDVDAYNRRGCILNLLGRRIEAGTSFHQAIQLNPQHTEAVSNLANLLYVSKSHAMAGAWFARLLELDPDYPRARGALAYAHLHLARWDNLAESMAGVTAALHAGKPAAPPMAYLALEGRAQDQLTCARLYSAAMFPPNTPPAWEPTSHTHGKIRLAYVSGDFREHPVGHLMAGVVQRHDRARFEVTGISLGPDDQGPLRKRFEAGFDRFVDARQTGHYPLVALMRELRIDVAVDLSGFSDGSRTELFASRVAPVQVNLLGYPGTMGAPFMDYIVGDAHVIPANELPCYTEQVVHLPHTYLPTDADLQVAQRTPTREEVGLPANGFLFCCFNHIYKLNPTVFDVWMALLAQVPGSVLWLSTPPEPAATDNLRAHAQARGIHPDRLVFAGRVPQVQDHLARYRLADLFLDTTPYNAHTTAADALFVGLPVLTCSGPTFASRVAGSLLRAAGLPELVTHTLDDYRALALKLATDGATLAALKARLLATRAQQPLFNTDQYTRYLEMAYMNMVARSRRGEPPQAFAVQAAAATQTQGTPHP